MIANGRKQTRNIERKQKQAEIKLKISVKSTKRHRNNKNYANNEGNNEEKTEGVI